MDRTDLEKRLKEYLQEDIMSEDGAIMAEVNTVNGEMTVLSNKLTEDFVDDKRVTSVILEDKLVNIFPDIYDMYDEDGIEIFKREGFPMTFKSYKDITMELKLIDNVEKLPEEKVRFIRPNMVGEDYTLVVNLEKLEKYKDQFDEEEYERFINFVDENIDELVDEDKIIDKFVKAFHVDELVEVD